MTQPARIIMQDNRTDMGVPVSLTTANSDSSWQFITWLDQLLMAVTVKENVKRDLLLEDAKDILKSLQKG